MFFSSSSFSLRRFVQKKKRKQKNTKNKTYGIKNNSDNRLIQEEKRSEKR